MTWSPVNTGVPTYCERCTAGFKPMAFGPNMLTYLVTNIKVDLC